MATDPDRDPDRVSRVSRELCARRSEWAAQEPQAPQVLGPLGGGHSNSALLLRGARDDYVLRIGARPPPRGVDRQREFAVASAAASAGIAPPLLHCEPQRGLLITRFVGEPVDGEFAAAHAGEVAELLRSIHALPAPGPAMHSAARLHSYRADLPATSPCAALLERHAGTLQASGELLRKRRGTAVLCHNDLLPANLRRWHGRLIALDWEYAAAGDPFFDIAVAASAQPGDAAGDTLLQTYLRRTPTAAEMQGYRAQQLIYAALACCWYELHGNADAAPTRAARARLQALLAGAATAGPDGSAAPASGVLP